jgi:hypothetical protein
MYCYSVNTVMLFIFGGNKSIYSIFLLKDSVKTEIFIFIMHQFRVFLRECDNCLQEMDKHKQENNILNRTRHFKRILRNFERV